MPDEREEQNRQPVSAFTDEWTQDYMMHGQPKQEEREITGTITTGEKRAIAAYERHCQENSLTPNDEEKQKWIKEWLQLNEEARQEAVDVIAQEQAQEFEQFMKEIEQDEEERSREPERLKAVNAELLKENEQLKAINAELLEMLNEVMEGGLHYSWKPQTISEMVAIGQMMAKAYDLIAKAQQINEPTRQSSVKELSPEQEYRYEKAMGWKAFLEEDGDPAREAHEDWLLSEAQRKEYEEKYGIDIE